MRSYGRQHEFVEWEFRNIYEAMTDLPDDEWEEVQPRRVVCVQGPGSWTKFQIDDVSDSIMVFRVMPITKMSTALFKDRPFLGRVCDPGFCKSTNEPHVHSIPGKT
jgi:hypothetical protein